MKRGYERDKTDCGALLSLGTHMTLASWSTRRILALWAGGLVLQALLMLAPVLLAQRLMANSGELRRVGAQHDARWRSGDLADSLSLARQRSDARASGSYSITPSGDTLFALVHVPSGRPDSSVVAALSQRLQREARYATILILGLIPALLIILTLRWMFVRHLDAGSRASFGAA